MKMHIVLKVNFLIRILNTILYFYYFRLLCGWRLLGVMVYSSTARVGNSRKNPVSIRSFSHCKYIHIVLMIDKVSFAPHMNIWIILCSDFFFALSLFKMPKGAGQRKIFWSVLPLNFSQYVNKYVCATKFKGKTDQIKVPYSISLLY